MNIIATTATFDPETARTCATPESMNACFVSTLIPERSPMRSPLRNSPSSPPTVASICASRPERSGTTTARMSQSPSRPLLTVRCAIPRTNNEPEMPFASKYRLWLNSPGLRSGPGREIVPVIFTLIP